ncbi:hypothetical protein BD309DRAFT_1022293 [Dichomitus squalens]|nr:hypothetical protein BD309DRAFT_1022293 [Dichomitus squalens]
MLEHVARRCPRLVVLRIPMDFVHDPALPAEPLPVPAHPLAELSIFIRRFDPCMRPDQVTRLVDRLFPRLVYGARMGGQPFLEETRTRWNDMWREVWQLQTERTGEVYASEYCTDDEELSDWSEHSRDEE